MDILMAIKPRYVNLMRSCIKRVELRKKMRMQDVGRIFIYETNPIKMVIAFFEPTDIIHVELPELWESVKNICGLEQREFDNYFIGKSMGYGIFFRGIVPIVPTELKVINKHPPQSYVLLKEEESMRLLMG